MIFSGLFALYIALRLAKLDFNILHNFSMGFRLELDGGRKITLMPSSNIELMTMWPPWYVAKSRTTKLFVLSIGKLSRCSSMNCWKEPSLLPSLVTMYLNLPYLFEIAPITWTLFLSLFILDVRSSLNLFFGSIHVFTLLSQGSQDASSTNMISLPAAQWWYN